MRRLVLSLAAAVFGSITVATAASAQTAALVVSRLGGKCMDAEGGIGRGKRIIGYPCTGASNQMFTFYSDGTIRLGGYCLDVYGGVGNDGDQIVLWDCLRDAYGRPQANQRWTADPYNRLIGLRGKCIDLKGGSGGWYINNVWNQPAILWPCKVEDNQIWYRGEVFPASQVSGATKISSGALTTIKPFTNIVAGGAGNLIGQDGSSIVAGGAGNIVATDGATIIAGGAGNIIAGGAGNVVVVTKTNRY